MMSVCGVRHLVEHPSILKNVGLFQWHHLESLGLVRTVSRGPTPWRRYNCLHHGTGLGHSPNGHEP